MTDQTPDTQRGRGALDELARDDSSRKRFLRSVGGAGAAGALGVLLAACGDDKKDSTTSTAASTGTGAAAASSGDMKGDLDIVNYALTLEYLEAQFYADVLKSGVIKDPKVGSLAKKFGQTEQEHVDALIATAKKLGGTPAGKPKASFQSVIEKGPSAILKAAADVENLGAAAYLGQAANIKSKEILAAALAIHSVEARHAAVLNDLIGADSTPDGAFGKPASMSTVLAAVKPFIVS